MLAAGLAAPAAAGEVARAGEAAEAALAAGDTVKALAALEGAVDSVWREGPLAFRKALAVDSVAGFADYEPRDDKPYAPGEAMQVYVEPVGFAYAPEGGKHRVRMSADLAITNPTGQVIVEGKDMFSIDTALAQPRREFDLVLSYKVPELAPGSYTAEFKLRDAASGKEASFSVPFEIAASTAEKTD
ncbi:hypothetical protein CLD20_09425 [Afifella sp. IM 167]|nr:hypothetical protein [Afifella sp. IM 167]